MNRFRRIIAEGIAGEWVTHCRGCPLPCTIVIIRYTVLQLQARCDAAIAGEQPLKGTGQSVVEVA